MNETNIASRQPVHTVYGGAHLFAPTPPRKLGALALRALEEYAPDARRARRGARHADAIWRRASTRASSRSSRASRSRTSASTSRTATATGPTPRRTATRGAPPREVAAGLARGHAAAVHRHPHQAAQRASCSAARLRTLDIFLTTLRRGDRRHAARRTSWSRCRRSRIPSRSRRWPTAFERLETALGLRGRHRCARDHDRDAAVDPRRDGRVALPLLARRGARPLRRRALRHLRLHRVAATSPRRTSTWPTRPATSPST